jgi:hypothetical protein
MSSVIRAPTGHITYLQKHMLSSLNSQHTPPTKHHHHHSNQEQDIFSPQFSGNYPLTTQAITMAVQPHFRFNEYESPSPQGSSGHPESTVQSNVLAPVLDLDLDLTGLGPCSAHVNFNVANINVGRHKIESHATERHNTESHNTTNSQSGANEFVLLSLNRDSPATRLPRRNYYGSRQDTSSATRLPPRNSYGSPLDSFPAPTRPLRASYGSSQDTSPGGDGHDAVDDQDADSPSLLTIDADPSRKPPPCTKTTVEDAAKQQLPPPYPNETD